VEILRLIANGTERTADLARHFKVTATSIHTWLDRLQAAGLLRRYHGYARVTEVGQKRMMEVAA
jgi:DeoR/GlpR family transcriptional regulator of sugar metabolism